MRRLGWIWGAPLLVLLLTPFVALVAGTSVTELRVAVEHPTLVDAAWLSARTSCLSLVTVIVCGTPLAWWLSRATGWGARLVETLVELPIVIPPAVVGVALLEAYGRHGLLGGPLAAAGLSLSFSTGAVVVAQVVVSAPFFVQAATAGFRGVDPDMMLVARTLGAPPLKAFLRVAVPSAAPALVGGAALGWARSLGEFGATLLFAGSLPGTTQTMPLAIFSALEADVGLARSLSVLLGVAALAALLLMRAVPRLQRDR